MAADETPFIHLNNAGAAMVTEDTFSAMIKYLSLEYKVGGYEAFAQCADRIDAVRTSVGQLLNCSSDQVALVESATVGWDRAVQAIAFDDPPPAGSRILIASSEYASNAIPLLQLARKTGARVEFIPDGPDGALDVEAFSQMLDEDVHLVSITHAPSHNGVVNDIIGAGDALRFNGSSAWYLVDACQSAGQIPLDFARIGADAVSATGRKFLRGPRGTGFVAFSTRMLTDIEPFPLDLRSATWTSASSYEVQSTARRFETWEMGYAGMAALGAAIDQALELGIDEIHAAISQRAEQLRQGLSEIPGVQVRDRGTHRSGIVTITVPHPSAAVVVAQLRKRSINTSLSTADYAPVDFAHHDITEQIRLSPHTYISESEIDHAISVVADLLH